MSLPSTEDALAAYRQVHRALLTSTASKWRNLDLSMQQLRAMYFLRDEEEMSVGRLAELFGIGLPAASLLADRLLRSGYVEPPDEPATTTERKGIDRGVLAVFAGLMLGSLVASLTMPLVAQALPTIVAELGGIADYSWIPISAMLASTIVVPVAGKLSDIYGRKPLYMTGIVVFAIGSALSGIAPNFWFLVFSRFVQGAGMGFIMPLSQAIIGDIISPRERGKYQGMMGASFGVASIIGPAAGGYITQNFSWRWLFFINIPFAVLTLLVVALYMHVPNERRKHAIDVWGSITLSSGITCALLATVWGGGQYPWDSWQIIGLYSAAAILLAAFVWVETRAEEPVLPLRLWQSSLFTFSTIATPALPTPLFAPPFSP